MRHAFSDIYFQTEQQQNIITGTSPGEALEHYYISRLNAEEKDDIYGIAVNSAVLGGILARYDVNIDAVDCYTTCLKSYERLLEFIDCNEGKKIKTRYSREYEGTLAKKERDTEEKYINRQDIQQNYLWNMLELCYIYSFNGQYDEYDKLLASFNEKAASMGYFDEADIYSELNEASKEPEIKMLKINEMKRMFVPVIIHHLELLKLMNEYLKTGHVSVDNAEKYSEIMYLSNASRHLDYTVMIYYSILNDGNLDLAKKYLDRLQAMDDGTLDVELSYRQAAADYYLSNNDMDKFEVEVSITEQLMNKKRFEYSRSKHKSMYNEETAFNQEQKLNEFADEIKKVTEKASTDTLTLLPNRYAIYERLPEIINEAADKNEDIALVLIDIDHFKHFNDTFGHRGGDGCLRAVADVIKEVYGEFFVARYGGDEYLAVITGEKAQNIRAYAEQVQAKLCHVHVDDVTEPITVTQGVARIKAQHDMSWQRLFDYADNSLYKGKNSVRNCIVCMNL